MWIAKLYYVAICRCHFHAPFFLHIHSLIFSALCIFPSHPPLLIYPIFFSLEIPFFDVILTPLHFPFPIKILPFVYSCFPSHSLNFFSSSSSYPYTICRILFMSWRLFKQCNAFILHSAIIALCIIHLTCKAVLLSILTLMSY